jgi:hypothetical protein
LLKIRLVSFSFIFINLYVWLLAEPGKPGAPECASRDRDHIEVKWAPPRNDGGNPIKGYIVERLDKAAKKKEWAKVNRGDLQKVSLIKARMKRADKKLVYKTH